MRHFTRAFSTLDAGKPLCLWIIPPKNCCRSGQCSSKDCHFAQQCSERRGVHICTRKRLEAPGATEIKAELSHQTRSRGTFTGSRMTRGFPSLNVNLIEPVCFIVCHADTCYLLEKVPYQHSEIKAHKSRQFCSLLDQLTLGTQLQRTMET